jgi:hypothetical protein
MSVEVAVVDRWCAVVYQHDIPDDITIYISNIRINICLFPQCGMIQVLKNLQTVLQIVFSTAFA